MVELDAKHALCREPSMKQQRTASRAGRWYDAEKLWILELLNPVFQSSWFSGPAVYDIQL